MARRPDTDLQPPTPAAEPDPDVQPQSLLNRRPVAAGALNKLRRLQQGYPYGPSPGRPLGIAPAPTPSAEEWYRSQNPRGHANLASGRAGFGTMPEDDHARGLAHFQAALQAAGHPTPGPITYTTPGGDTDLQPPPKPRR